MLVEYTDFNNADKLFAISGSLAREWGELKTNLEGMPLHLKGSDQAGMVGSPIFDVVGTNQHIGLSLAANDWNYRVIIPPEFNFLGTDIDFFKSGILAEVQFSNYPFLLNNLIRSELFYKAKTLFVKQHVSVAVIITKAKMFPASNSTLYYEQAVRQISALTENNVFEVPMRVVGLFSPLNTAVRVRWTTYPGQRSRTVSTQEDRQAVITPGRGVNSRTVVTLY